MSDLIELKDVREYLVGVAIGVRFRSNFALEDQLGTIVDEILYSDNSYFNPKMFPQVSGAVSKKTLVNRETGNYLHLDSQNIILEFYFPDDGIGDFDNLISAYRRQIVDGVMLDHKVTQITRIGLIHKYSFSEEVFANNFVDLTVGDTMGGVNDLALRFSKKYPTDEGLVKKGVNDYRNVILTIVKQPEQAGLSVDLDYQQYYEPYLTNSGEIKYSKFIESALRYNQDTFPTWLNKYLGRRAA